MVSRIIIEWKKRKFIEKIFFLKIGSLSGELIEFRRSEQYLTELFEGDEGICKVMDDYAKAKYKTTGKLTILKMFIDGGMNPLMSEVDFVQDQDLNKSLKHYCLEVLDEFDEVFLEYFMAPELDKNVVDEICLNRTKICENYEVDDDENDEEEQTSEPNLPEKEL